MSSSASRSLEAAAPAKEKVLPEMQPFPYEPIPAGARGAALEGLTSGRGWPTDGGIADAAGREAQARLQGRQEGQVEAAKVHEEQLARERAALSAVLTDFARDRALYFQRVEGEVVQLALSIARKILHREAQLDPLLLAGIARVAIEKIDGATEVLLKVHPLQVAEWRKYFNQRMAREEAPEIVEDPALEPGRCILQTSMGTAVLGLETQLKEIEQGLMDLMAARPGASS
jgi:flagellar assembly protein FliH